MLYKINDNVIYRREMDNVLMLSPKTKKLFIFKKELFSNGNKPKNYIEELDNYNGLTFLGGFMWD